MSGEINQARIKAILDVRSTILLQIAQDAFGVQANEIVGYLKSRPEKAQPLLASVDAMTAVYFMEWKEL